MLKTFVFILVINSFLFSNTFKIGYMPNSTGEYSNKEIELSITFLLNNILKDLNLEVVTKIYKDIDNLKKDLSNNKIDYLSGTGLSFVKYLDLSLLDNGFSKGYKDNRKNRYLILVRKNSNIKKLSELKNRVVGLKQYEEIMEIYLDMNLKGKTNLRFFDSHRKSLLKLYFGEIDAAVYTEEFYEIEKELNPQIGKKIEVLALTDLNANVFGFLRESMDEKLKKAVRKKAKNLHLTQKGQSLLELFKTEVLTESKFDDLKPFEEIYNKYSNK